MVRRASRSSPVIRRYQNLDALSVAAASVICELAEESVRERGLFTVALSGGVTPKPLYSRLAKPPLLTRIPWAQSHLFWGDERCVPPHDPHSNFSLAFETLISKVPIPAENVHRIPVELEPPEMAASAYEEILRGFFPPSKQSDSGPIAPEENGRFPALDLILLGVGKDGHTASLFPSDGVLEERRRWVAAVKCPRGMPSVSRITLTLPLINRARTVLFLVSGAGKREVVESILGEEEPALSSFPAGRIDPDGRLLWFLDDEYMKKDRIVR